MSEAYLKNESVPEDELYSILANLASAEGSDDHPDMSCAGSRFADVGGNGDVSDGDDDDDGGEGSKDKKKKRKRRPYSELTRNIVCPWPECQRCYASKHALQLHMKNKHNWFGNKKMPDMDEVGLRSIFKAAAGKASGRPLSMGSPSNMLHMRSMSLDCFDRHTPHMPSAPPPADSLSFSEEMISDMLVQRGSQDHGFGMGGSSRHGSYSSQQQMHRSSYTSQSGYVSDLPPRGMPEWNQIDDLMVRQMNSGPADFGPEPGFGPDVSFAPPELVFGGHNDQFVPKKSLASRFQQNQEVRRTASMSSLHTVRKMDSPGSVDGIASPLNYGTGPNPAHYHPGLAPTQGYPHPPTASGAFSPTDLSSPHHQRQRSQTFGSLHSPSGGVYNSHVIASPISRPRANTYLSAPSREQGFGHFGNQAPSQWGADRQTNWDSLVNAAVDASIMSPNLGRSQPNLATMPLDDQSYAMNIGGGGMGFGGSMNDFGLLGTGSMEYRNDGGIDQGGFNVNMATSDEIMANTMANRLLYG